MNNKTFNLNGIVISNKQEYAIALRNAYERLRVEKRYANTYYNFYTFIQNNNNDIIFISKIEINNDTNVLLLSFIGECGGMVDVNR